MSVLLKTGMAFDRKLPICRQNTTGGEIAREVLKLFLFFRSGGWPQFSVHVFTHVGVDIFHHHDDAVLVFYVYKDRAGIRACSHIPTRQDSQGRLPRTRSFLHNTLY